jgi:agmatinase
MTTDPTHLPGSSGSMPYVGVASFLKLALVPAGQADGYDFLVFGIPFDEGTSNRPGARFGPRAIRAASTLYSYEGGAELFDVELGRTILAGARVGDRGDVPISPGNGEADREMIAQAVAGIVGAGAVPVAVGGDHSVTASILRGLARARPAEPRPYLVHLDTHMDFDSYLPAYAHGTPIRQAMDESLVAGVTQVGIRGFNSGKADWEEAQRRGVQVVTRESFTKVGTAGVLELVPADAPLYLSIDIDVFDPGIAPGTGTPEPGGLAYSEGRALIRALARHGTVIGLDVVEVNPQYDHGEITAILAARLILDAMGAVWEARPDQSQKI